METLQQELFAPRTQKDRILDRLAKAGHEGVSNYELNKIAFRYAARIQELRKDGYQISTIQLKKGLFTFVLHQDDEPMYEELPQEPINWWGRKALQ